MKVFTCNDFTGHWPVGAAALIVAETEEQAMEYLDVQLRLVGLDTRGATLEELDVNMPIVKMLCDGDY